MSDTVSGGYEHADDQQNAEARPAHPAPRLCAHADQDGRGMHVLQPGERCPDAP